MNVAVLHPSKLHFVLKHSQVLSVQSWSLKMLCAWQNQKKEIHPVGQETPFRTTSILGFQGCAHAHTHIHINKNCSAVAG